MTKVSKNLKKLRTSKGFTQDALSEKLFVTRQTVSGWETGRTEPDIEMLVKISEVLGVEVEDLIYGERKVLSENEKSIKTRKILSTLFAIIASVFTAVGIVLIFVTGWERFPVAMKALCSFMPMLISQAVVIFTYLKHKESAVWRESAAVAWCIGVASSVALLDSTFSIKFGFETCLLADIILLLPVIYILDAVVPLIVYYFASGTLGVLLFDIHESDLLTTLIVAVLYLGGAYYTFKNRQNKDDIRQNYSQWISALALGVLGSLYLICLTDMVYVFAIILLISLCFYITENDGSWANPLKTIGLLGIIVSSVINGFILPSEKVVFELREAEKEEIIFMIFSIAVVALTFALRRKQLRKTEIKRLFCILAFIEMVAILFNYIFMKYGNIYVYLLSVVLAIAASLALVADGAISAKFVTLNLGLVSALILTGTVIFIFVDIDIFTTGILLLVCGLMLFAVNYLLSKRIAKSKKEGENHE